MYAIYSYILYMAKITQLYKNYILIIYTIVLFVLNPTYIICEYTTILERKNIRNELYSKINQFDIYNI